MKGKGTRWWFEKTLIWCPGNRNGYYQPSATPSEFERQLDLAFFWAEHFPLSLWGNLHSFRGRGRKQSWTTHPWIDPTMGWQTQLSWSAEKLPGQEMSVRHNAAEAGWPICLDRGDRATKVALFLLQVRDCAAGGSIPTVSEMIMLFKMH